ncbi:MAG: RNA polymerase sigma-70 factor [Filimonas sp.]|nr:RNA polymerase sigma-70 factor [Filimonas sp.]
MEVKKQYIEFRVQFEKYYTPLCKYALGYLKDKDLSEDIVQDVFVTIWEKRKDLITSVSIKYYLFAAVRNNCLTHLSKKNKLPVEPLMDCNIPDEDGWLTHETANAGNPVNYSGLLEDGINQLPIKCKEVFLLNRLGNMTNQQIADTLNISVKTVNNQLWKAMKMLRAFAKSAKNWLLFFFI